MPLVTPSTMWRALISKDLSLERVCGWRYSVASMWASPGGLAEAPGLGGVCGEVGIWNESVPARYRRGSWVFSAFFVVEDD